MVQRYRYSMFETLDDVTNKPINLDEDLCNYSDYAAIARERDELKAKLKEWPLVRDSFMSKIEELASQNAALLQRVQELEKRLEPIEMMNFKF